MRLTCQQPFEERLTSDEPKIYVFSLASVHLRLRTLASIHLPLHLHTSTHLYATCTSTLSLLQVHPFFLSFFIDLFSTVLDNHMSRSRATRRLVSNLSSRHNMG